MPSKRSHEKRSIRSAFSRATDDYDSVAEVQRQAADLLLTGLPGKAATRVLDAGCGTGYVSHQLRAHPIHQHAQCISLDLALSMTRRAHLTSESLPLCGDIEALPLAEQSIDLYISSLAWQWTQALVSLREAARVLKPGGQLLVATLGENTMHELRAVFSHIDDNEHVRPLEVFENYSNQIQQTGFDQATITRTTLRSFSPDLRSLLRDIRTLGAHVTGLPRRQGLIARSTWKQLQEQYEQWRTEEGLPVTYDVILIKATKLGNTNGQQKKS